MKKVPTVHAESVKRSFSVPSSLDADLSFVAYILGVSRSALVSQLLGEPVSQLRSLFEEISAESLGTAPQRLRGKSKALIQERIQAVLDEVEREFSGSGEV